MIFFFETKVFFDIICPGDIMLYFDYSATTPIEDAVLETYQKVCRNYWGNPNSIHSFGSTCKRLMEEATSQVAKAFSVKSSEVIFTSSASEANNLAIKGIAHQYQNRSRHIITTQLEHSSVLETVSFLEKEGFQIHYVDLDSNGLVNISHLKELLERYHPILVSICAVNSEVGILQDIDKIKSLLKEYPLTYFHVDATQVIGKIPFDLKDIDLCSFSGHKIYGPKGIGCLIKKEKIELTPLIHGGRSQTIYRASTPPLELIVSFAKALNMVLQDMDKKYKYVCDLNKKLITYLKKCDDITINSNEFCIPHIINVSLKHIKSETFLHALEEKEVYVSTKTACSSDKEESQTLKAMGKPREISTRSIRISLSFKTTEEELKQFKDAFTSCLEELKFMKGTY